MKNYEATNALQHAIEIIQTEHCPGTDTKGYYFAFGNVAVKISEIQNVKVDEND